MAGLSPIAGGATRWLVRQTVDPTAVLGASRTARASAAVALVLVVGGILVWRFEPFVDRSIDASMARPLRSTAYGVAAHAVVAVSGVLLTGQLSQIPVSRPNPAVIGPLFGLAVLLVAGALGFTVIGAVVVERSGESSRWAGLVAGAVVAGGVAVVDPAVAGVGWLLVVSTGIGGPIRTWLHASAVADG